ncbi:Membrane-anchored protein YidD, putatitve component of membrane protein insertase Oxa1/YidC/SpoIIIJ [Flexibacter flexilis DSM 6793]|uniref:Membrane-anchored protein YidD, putatitve component of membrane protein insertase Oxa1/YidC/SpoIIIJ n=1 Tax=Flexibacter flexilis DSM 6793 TaxID=927664 RepID=A0A1I1MCN0_9BACT|nr:membrane protein insertion efficiency factor YidD [Flexibacter flexilis]SFC82592.1 Membrane-anchored protein YidD, putatitve component of membrane protein insertase Oxa1/YidC/SpoIIIJ [Flexibacter flexilis DSM 6793]
MPKLSNLLKNKWLLGVVFLVLFPQKGISQNRLQDLQLLSHADTLTKPVATTHYKGYNPLKWALHGSLSFYQNVISRQISASCLYHTSCSRFSRKALQEFGILKGIALTTDRLGRCNRIAATDIRPVRIGADGLVEDEPYMYRLKK